MCSVLSRLLMLARVAADDPGDIENAILLDFQLDVSVVTIGVIHYPGYPSRPRRIAHQRAEYWESGPQALHDVVDHLAVGRRLAADQAQGNSALIESRIGETPAIDIIEQLDQLPSCQRGRVVMIPFRHWPNPPR